MLIHAIRRSQACGPAQVPAAGPWAEQGVVVPIEGAARNRASMLLAGINPLQTPLVPIPEPPPVPTLAVWSGWLDLEDADTEDDPDDRGLLASMRAWSGQAWTSLEASLSDLADQASRLGVRLAVRPRASHVVSDAQRCVRLLERHQNQPIDLLLEPTMLLTPAMLSESEDHLIRIFDALAGHDRTIGLVLTNVRRTDRETTVPGSSSPSSSGPSSGLVPSPLNSGELDGRRLCELAAPYVSRDRPLLLLEQDLTEQITLARLAGLG